MCGKKRITCSEDRVIDIIWSRVAYSEYWELDGNRNNCTVTDENCYKEIEEPAHNCSGLTECIINTCSRSTYQILDCTQPKATNVLQINYTCIEGK
jgi:hypothetical protein